MKMKLIAIVIAAALAPAAAAADTGNVNLYGRLNASVDSQSGAATAAAFQTQNTFVNTNSSRLGVRGSEDLGDGMSAIFQMEANVNLTGTGRGGNGNTVANSAAANYGLFGGQVRDSFVGLSANWGKIQIGRLPMTSHWVYESNLFADQIGDLGNFNSPAGMVTVGTRANGEVLYTTPNMSGFTANVQYYPRSSIVPDATLGAGAALGAGGSPTDSWGTKLNFNGKGTALPGLNTSFNYLSISTGLGLKFTPWVVSASYDFGPGLVSAQYLQDLREQAGDSVDRSTFNVGGKYKVTENGVIKVQYSSAGDANGSGPTFALGIAVNGLTPNVDTGAQMFVIGYDYNFSKRTSVYMAYASTNNRANSAYGVGGNGHNNQQPTSGVNGNDLRAFGVGVAHNF
jgi:predicted porin